MSLVVDWVDAVKRAAALPLGEHLVLRGVDMGKGDVLQHVWNASDGEGVKLEVSFLPGEVRLFRQDKSGDRCGFRQTGDQTQVRPIGPKCPLEWMPLFRAAAETPGGKILALDDLRIPVDTFRGYAAKAGDEIGVKLSVRKPRGAKTLIVRRRGDNRFPAEPMACPPAPARATGTGWDSNLEAAVIREEAIAKFMRDHWGSKKYLAKLAGVHPSEVSKWLQGRRDSARLDFAIQEFARDYGMSIAWIDRYRTLCKQKEPVNDIRKWVPPLYRNEPDDKKMIPKEASQILQVPVRLLTMWRERGRGPAWGTCLDFPYYRMDSLLEFMKECIVDGVYKPGLPRVTQYRRRGESKTAAEMRAVEQVRPPRPVEFEPERKRPTLTPEQRAAILAQPVEIP